MSIKKTYAVFGLGRYGTAVAKGLVASGAEVIAIDADEGKVNAAIEYLPVCKRADITDPEVLSRIGISNIDVVIICMAERLEASVMATMLCKEAGVETVIVKCGSEMHKKILYRVGADKVVFPESESGERLAKNLLSDGFVDLMELSNEISMIEIDVKPEWVGKTLIELNLRKKYSLNIIAVRNPSGLSIDISPDTPLTEDMKLVLLIKTSMISKLV